MLFLQYVFDKLCKKDQRVALRTPTLTSKTEISYNIKIALIKVLSKTVLNKIPFRIKIYLLTNFIIYFYFIILTLFLLLFLSFYSFIFLPLFKFLSRRITDPAWLTLSFYLVIILYFYTTLHPLHLLWFQSLEKLQDARPNCYSYSS